ncbi:MAG: glycoside hydrolase family 97 protein [Candidatus Cryptobacteroides sp.]|nr:glycoside hydrolase family 97 protein [Candidatus Cryptobacteroides sp.]
MIKKIFLTLAVVLSAYVASAQKHYEVISPDGSLKADVEITDGKILYSVIKNGSVVLSPSEVAMTLSDGSVYDGTVKLRKSGKTSVDSVVESPFYKKSHVKENYNQLALNFKTFDLVFRAYDAGVAYRFVSKSKTPFKVVSETAQFAFPADWNMYVPYVCQNIETLESQYFNSFENRYEHVTLSAWNKDRLAFLPLMVESPEGYKINIMESALTDYPGMYLYNSDADTVLEARFAPYPKEIKQGGHNSLQGLVSSREDYIASYDGAVSFPWRIVNVSSSDTDMLDNDLVWLLGTPADPQADWSWVKPGKVAWEWWNNWHVTGVDFKAGVNNDTYKYYIDFASKYGIEYVILDEGWAVKGKADLFNVVPEIDIKELCDYAAQKNVGIVLWAGYWAFDKDMEKICSHYARMGVKGWKIDFMDRDDQMMVDFYTRAAHTAAKYHQFVDFHGAYKPCGLNRTFPNVLNYEGVHGLEQMKWSKVGTDQLTYDVTFPYIRMAAGPVDYTQGAMRNYNYKWYKPCYVDPVSQGTRCHQLGMYVIFESPFNMLCDSPQHYEQEKECTEFIAKIPTVWYETVALDGKVGEYIVMARRNGTKWYVGGLVGHDARTVTVDLGFLGEGDWKMELFKDGINATRHAEDYTRIEGQAGETLTVEVAPGGGFAAIFTK